MERPTPTPRIAGGPIPSGVACALDAVPAAILTTLVAAALLAGRPLDIAALVIAGLVIVRAGRMTMFAVAPAVLVAGHLLLG